MNSIVCIKKNDIVLFKGCLEGAREFIEGALYERLGIYIALQEDIEEGNVILCVHSSAYDELSDKEFRTLEQMRITFDDATEGIKRFLNIKLE